jgi:hypothetical protein
MTKQVYISKRKQLINNILTARRCKLNSVARRFQAELANLRMDCVA